MIVSKAPPASAGPAFEAPVSRANTAKAAGPGISDAEASKPQFSETWKKIQAEYGAKPEKPREIKKTLGKDDFMKIMVTQMQHQDPTAPFKAEQMAQQMAQYSSVEQLQNMNQKLERLTTANAPLERMAMTGLIGKTVTVDKERFPYNEGNKVPLGFEIPKNAASVSVTVVSQAGEPVYTKDLGPMKKGAQSHIWEGLMSNSQPAKSGTYMYVVNAKDEQGLDIQISSKGQAQVVGVSFEGTDPVLLIGDPSSPQKVLMSSVVRIDSNGGLGGGGLIPGAASLAAASGQPDPHAVAQSMSRNRMAARNGDTSSADEAAAAADGASKGPQALGNFFSFRKGVGSETLDRANMSEEASAALAMYEEQRSSAQRVEALAAKKGAPDPSSEERGFPNGLNN